MHFVQADAVCRELTVGPHPANMLPMMHTGAGNKAAIVTLICGIIAVVCFMWHWFTRPVLVLGPMVQQVGTDSFVLFWAVHPPTTASVAEVIDPAGRSAETTAVVQQPGRYLATVTGLQPDTSYSYRILTGGLASRAPDVLAQHSVRTAPTTEKPFRFVALGDTGVGDRFQFGVARVAAQQRPDLILHTGDLIYPRGRLEENARKFFQPYAELLASVPIYACLGNHEYRMPGCDPVPDSFVLPPNGPDNVPPERYYWFDYSSARFVILDSNNDEPFFAEMIAPWLDKVLSSAAGRYKIVVFHEPVVTHGKYPPSDKLIKTIVPVMERHRVHLALCGHNHMYERSYPIRDGRLAASGQGTIYITSGAGGANLAEARLPMPDRLAAWNDRLHSLTVCDVACDLLTVRQITIDSRLIDEFTVVRNWMD